MKPTVGANGSGENVGVADKAREHSEYYSNGKMMRMYSGLKSNPKT